MLNIIIKFCFFEWLNIIDSSYYTRTCTWQWNLMIMNSCRFNNAIYYPSTIYSNNNLSYQPFIHMSVVKLLVIYSFHEDIYKAELTTVNLNFFEHYYKMTLAGFQLNRTGCDWQISENYSSCSKLLIEISLLLQYQTITAFLFLNSAWNFTE